MNYGKKFLDKIRNFSVITITGPQRSGTTIAAAIIAKELNRKLILEEQFDVDNFLKYVGEIHNEEIVIQAPALSSVAHHFPGAVVFMRRNVEDIIDSQVRISWKEEISELGRYFVLEGPISQIKYSVWDNFQKPLLGNRAFDLKYDSLKGHQMWIQEKSRTNFKPRQYK